jgi:hypothetical protein
MKLNADTIKILQSFQSINQSLLFKEGNLLETITTEKTVWAKAEVSNSFPKEFAIFDLGRFLGIVSMFPESEIEFFDTYLKVTSDKSSVKYHFADAGLLVKTPKKAVVLTGDDLVEFTLEEKTFEAITNAMKILRLPEVAVVGDGSKISLKAIDFSAKTNDEFSVDVGETDRNFKLVFKWDNLKLLIDGTYAVKISPKGLAHFKKDHMDFFIAVESKSEV